MPSFDNIRVALRDLFIAGLLVACLVWPSLPRRFVDAMGVTHAEIFGSKFDLAGAKAQAEKVSQTNTDADALLATLKGAVSADPGLSGALNHALDLAKSLHDSAQSADAVAKATLVQQQQAAPDAVSQANDGWIFLGLTDASHQSWSGQQTTDAASPDPERLKDSVLEVKDAVYVRNCPDVAPPGAGPGWRATQPILAALPERQRVRVNMAEIDRTKSGGFAVWAKIERLS